MVTKQEIKEYAKKCGANKCGIAPLYIYNELLPVLTKRGFVPFTRKNPEARINPAFHIKKGKSAIVCLFKYQNGTDLSVAKYARGIDYHIYVKDKLKKIAEILGDNYKKRIVVDSGGLPEKYLAYLAGLGFYGKNNLLYSDGLGSRFYIGTILTDAEIERDFPINKTCLMCNKCINACVGGALGDNYSFDYTKCASYLTQKEEPLTENEKEIIKKCGYKIGCDVCSDVCPLNDEKYLKG